MFSFYNHQRVNNANNQHFLLLNMPNKLLLCLVPCVVKYTEKTIAALTACSTNVFSLKNE